MVETSEDFEEMTEEEGAQLDEKLNLTKDDIVELREVERMLYQMEPTFKIGKYSELLEYIENAISSGEASLKKFQGIGLSLAILSSQRLIDSVKAVEIGVEDAEKLLFQAKRNFIDETYNEASKAVLEIKDITPRLHKKHREKLSEMIKAVESRIEEAKRIGANVRDVEHTIKEARSSLEGDSLMRCTESVRRAQDLIEKVRTDRIAVIKEAITFVGSLIENAKGIGANVEAPLRHLDKAKSLFDSHEFQMCMYTTIQAEEMTTELIHQQAKRASALQKALENRYMVVATGIVHQKSKSEDVAKEVQEAMTGLMRAKSVGEKFEGTSDSELKSSTGEKSFCPSCGNGLEYIEQYNRQYCYNCQKYV